VWLKDRAQAAAFAVRLEKRPGVEDVQTHSVDFAYWTQFLRERTRAR
jgi:hypothetical protein